MVLREAPSFPFVKRRSDFVDDSTLSRLRVGAQRGLRPERPEFAVHPLSALLVWILRKEGRWADVVKRETSEAEMMRGLLHLTDYHLHTFPKLSANQKSVLSLLVRRLIWCTASGIDIFSRLRMTSTMESYGGWIIPKSDVLSPLEQETRKESLTLFFDRCEKSTVMAFLSKTPAFLQGAYIFGRIFTNDNLELADDRGLEFGMTHRGDEVGYSLDSVKPTQSTLPALFQAHAAATSLLAPDPRGLLAIRRLLQSRNFATRRYFLISDRMEHRGLRVLPGFLSSLTGTPLRELVDFSLYAPNSIAEARVSFQNSGAEGAQKVLGYLCESEDLIKLGLIPQGYCPHEPYFLLSFVGPSRNRGMTSRICDQHLLAPIPSELAPLIRECRQHFRYSLPKSKVPTFGVLLRHDALEKIRSAMQSSFSEIGYRAKSECSWVYTTLCTFLRRPDRAFLYVASVQLGIAPALISLMTGRPFGIWRSALNYSCVSFGSIIQNFRRVQRALLVTADNDIPEKIPPPERILGFAGAGLLEGGRIGTPGLPDLETLVALEKVVKAGRSPLALAAHLSFLKSLLGSRYTADLGNPVDDYLGPLGLFSFTDKNLRGKIYPRLVPAPTALANQLADSFWAEFPKNFAVPASLAQKVRSIRLVTADKNAGRKALYSSLLRSYAGDETISSIFGHGLALTKIFGPISPIPTFWFLGEQRRLLDELTKTVGFEKAQHPTQRQVRRFREEKKPEPTVGSAEKTATEAAIIDVSVQHLPIPSEEALEDIQNLWRKIKMRWRKFEERPRDLRRCVFLTLALHAMPLRRLWLLRNYLRGNSLVRVLTHDKSAWFLIAPLPQKDLGLGLVPLRLSDEAGQELWEMLQCLAESVRTPKIKKADKTVSQRFDRSLLLPNFSKGEMENSLRLAARLTSSRRKKTDFSRIRTSIETASKFACRGRFGAPLFNSLNGRQIVPPNYFAIEDLLCESFGQAVCLTSVTGNNWCNYLVPSRRLELRQARIIRALRPGGVGRPSTIANPKPSRANFKDLQDYVHYFHQNVVSADASHIFTWLKSHHCYLPEYGPKDGKEFSRTRAYTLSARRIARDLLMQGRLHTGHPEHMLYPSQTERFLQLFDDQIASGGFSSNRQNSARWWVTIALFIGCRANEAPLIASHHVDSTSSPRIIRIPETKSINANRTIDLMLFWSDPIGSFLYQRLMTLDANRWPFARQMKFPHTNLGMGALQTWVNRQLVVTYAKLREEMQLPPMTGGFTLQSLRHACAFRVTQTLIDRMLWHGNMWTCWASLSTAMGHQSVVTTWCSYLGTAMLTLRWPARSAEGAVYRPLSDDVKDPLFSH